MVFLWLEGSSAKALPPSSAIPLAILAYLSFSSSPAESHSIFHTDGLKPGWSTNLFITQLKRITIWKKIWLNLNKTSFLRWDTVLFVKAILYASPHGPLIKKKTIIILILQVIELNQNLEFMELRRFLVHMKTFK